MISPFFIFRLAASLLNKISLTSFIIINPCRHSFFTSLYRTLTFSLSIPFLLLCRSFLEIHKCFVISSFFLAILVSSALCIFQAFSRNLMLHFWNFRHCPLTIISKQNMVSLSVSFLVFTLALALEFLQDYSALKPQIS